MSLTAGEYNEKYSDELERSFDKLEWYENIEERLWYYDSEQQITDDLVIIRNAVLNIYSVDDKVDWELIRPLKIKLNKLKQSLQYCEKKSIKDEELKIHFRETRNLINQIGNLNTSSWEKLKTKYEAWWLHQMKVETFNLFNSQVAKLSNIVDNLWESDDKINDLEKESTQLIKQFCNECDLYFERNKNTFNSIQSKDEKTQFVLDWLSEVIDIIWGSKFKIIFWRKFDILDTIEEYSITLYDLIKDYWLQEEIISHIKEFVISKL